MHKLNEGLEPLDLKRLLKPLLHIDRYKSKLGEDDDIIVLDFTIRGLEPGKELANFIEKGYDWVLDADVSSGEISTNNYLVFVELERRIEVPSNILRLIEEIENLTDQKIADWKFQYGKDDKIYPITLKNLVEKIPLSPHEYRELQNKLDSMKHAAGLNIENSSSTNEEINSLKRLSGLL
jgi:hypothetical protein